MKKLNFKFKHNPSTTWIMNQQTFEDFKKCISNLEYNTDTSAEHPIKDEDIVRYSNENQRSLG